MTKRTRSKGFTIIELVVFMVVAAICFMPIIIMVGEAVYQGVKPEVLTIATELAEGKMEEVLGGYYAGVQNDSGSFSSPLSDYSYQVSWYYVNAGDLDTSVSPTQTDYKNVKVTVSHQKISGVVLTCLLTQ